MVNQEYQQKAQVSLRNGKNRETSDSDVAQIRASYCGNATPTPPAIGSYCASDR